MPIMPAPNAANVRSPSGIEAFPFKGAGTVSADKSICYVICITRGADFLAARRRADQASLGYSSWGEARDCSLRFPARGS
jgi:hypothetical protein